MKQFFTLTAAVISLSAFTLFSGIDDVVNAIRSGNVAGIARYFDNTVEITMPDKSNAYSKSQAEMVLKDFFSTNTVKSFEIKHKGENGGSQFVIGTLVTRGGSFRTTVFMKQKDDKQLLQEIRFEAN
ncbi:MAG: DUF4783 domain-containing protein [Ferruginibacter sp.]